MRFLIILVSTVLSWCCPMIVCPFAHIVSERANELVSYNVNCLSHLNILNNSLTFAFSSVDFSHWVTSDSLWPHGLQHTRPSCPPPTRRASSNSGPSSQWCHSTISSSVILFSSCLESFPASGSLPMCQFFASGGQNIGASASASVLPTNIQDWFPFGFNGLISLLSKGLSRVFSNTTVQKHQFFGTQLKLRGPSLFMVQLSHPYMTTGKTIALNRQTFVGQVMSLFFNMLSKLVIAFLPMSKGFLISLFTVI